MVTHARPSASNPEKPSAMKVLTMNDDMLARACQRLERLVLRNGWKPDAVVGIARGGAVVAQRMFVGVPHAVADCHRQGTDVKDRHPRLMAIVRRSPLWVRNGLRMLESLMLGARREHKVTEPRLSDGAAEALANAVFILIVDDACDSGSTLRAVSEAVAKVCSAKVVIKSAVITTTTPRPVVNPDFSLYRNRTLIRFPWSKDTK